MLRILVSALAVAHATVLETRNDAAEVRAYTNALGNVIAEAVSKNAWRRQDAIYQSLFADLSKYDIDFSLSARAQPKDLAQIKRKAELPDRRVDEPRLNPDNPWKYSSDLEAFMLAVKEVDEIEILKEQVFNLATKAHLQPCVRPSSVGGPSLFMYAYRRGGCLTEIQINHEFAAWAFKLSTKNRDHPYSLPAPFSPYWGADPTGEQADLFYFKAQAMIIDPENPSNYFDLDQALKGIVSDARFRVDGKLPPGVEPHIDEASSKSA